MNTQDFELSDEMEMPTPCEKCNKWFDLNDGMGSEKWYPNTVICKKCGLEEAIEMEQDEEIEDLKNQLSDAKITIKDCKERLMELKVPELKCDMNFNAKEIFPAFPSFEAWLTYVIKKAALEANIELKEEELQRIISEGSFIKFTAFDIPFRIKII